MTSSRRNRRRKTLWEGIFFAHALTRRALSLWIFRIVPVGYIRLDRIAYIRRRSTDELRRLLTPGRCWYWPHPLWMGRAEFDHAPYTIRLVSGVQVFVRLRHGFHYMLRDAVGRAKAELAGRNSPAPPAKPAHETARSDVMSSRDAEVHPPGSPREGSPA